MPFPPNVKEDALVACGRCCCLCHKVCGIKIEVAHIKAEGDGGPNVLDNAIPLCFDCHADVGAYNDSHPKGNKYSASELKRHRDAWLAKVAGNVGIAGHQAAIETDKQVYNLLLKLLPWDGCIEFAREFDFTCGSFAGSFIEDFREFEHLCYTNPAIEFVDPDLEALRAGLLEHVKHFTRAISYGAFPHGADRYSIPKEFKFVRPEDFWPVIDDLHRTTKALVDNYDSLVRTATRKLGILPDGMIPQNTEPNV